MRDHHHAVEHRNAQERNKTHRGRHRQVLARHRQGHHTAHQSKRDVDKNDAGLAGRAEGEHQDHKDQDQRSRNHQPQAGGGALLVFKLSAPNHLDLARQIQRGHGFLCVLYKAGQVTAIHRSLDAGEARTLFVVNADRPVHQLDVGQGAGAPGPAIRRRQGQVLEGLGAVAQGFVAFEGEGRANAALQHHAQAFAFHLGFQVLLQGLDAETGLACGMAVDGHAQVLQALGLGGDDFGGAVDAAHGLGDFLRCRIDAVQVGAKHFDGHIAARAGQHFRNAHLDRLGKAINQARKAFQDTAQLGNDVVLAAAPFALGFEHQKGVGFVQTHRVQAQFVRARARHDGQHFGYVLQDRLLHPGVDFHGGLQRNGRQLLQLHQNIALVQRRHEGFAHLGVKARSQHQRQDRCAIQPARVPPDLVAQGHIATVDFLHHHRLVCPGFLQQDGSQRGDHGKGDQQRRRQRHDDGDGHRREQFALQPLQAQQRQKHHANDQHARDHGLDHLAHGGEQDFDFGQTMAVRVFFLRGGKCGFNVFHHHHRGVHQHAQCNGQAAQAHQVGGDAKGAHQQKSGQERQGQGHRHHQRGAHAAQEHIQDHADQDRGFDQGFDHRIRGAGDQFASVVKSFHGHAGRQAALHLLQFQAHRLNQVACVHAAHAQYQALYRFALAVFGHRAVARQSAVAHHGHIVEQDFLSPFGGGQANGAQIVQRFDRAFHTHHQRFFARRQAACTVVAVVAEQGLAQIVQRHAHGRHAGGVGDHLKGLHLAAQRVDLGHTGDGAQLGAYHPVQHAAFFGQAETIAFEREHVDL